MSFFIPIGLFSEQEQPLIGIEETLRKMSPNDPPEVSQELKALIHELIDALPSIRTIFLMPVVFGIAVTEKYLKDISVRQLKAKKLAQQRLLEDIQKRIEREKRAEEVAKSIREEERKALEELKIAEENREEERQRRLRQEQNVLTPRKLIYFLLSSASTIAIVLGVIRLAPIAKLSRQVNECIEETSNSKQGKKLLASEIMAICNPGFKK